MDCLPTLPSNLLFNLFSWCGFLLLTFTEFIYYVQKSNAFLYTNTKISEKN